MGAALPPGCTLCSGLLGLRAGAGPVGGQGFVLVGQLTLTEREIRETSWPSTLALSAGLLRRVSDGATEMLVGPVRPVKGRSPAPGWTQLSCLSCGASRLRLRVSDRLALQVAEVWKLLT